MTENSADPQKMVEWLMVESWAEHLRQQKTVSNADADLQGKLLTYRKGPDKPVVRHFLAIGRTRPDPKTSLERAGRIAPAL
ncbi:hypothetical protein AGR6A_pAt60167 [Agrobacterium sp. NCPPB 925]|nr:hypothetical protein AGR6A_pAt60167 [Agrobacterium sp. NCPPB 925]